ncbi:small, acid-soluble spore protein, alpha/beta type [Dethiobacter alkaliphilus]|uniref:Small, acid-soluble spore protein, alpha/beta family n=1 Tax=Dethiobacter alkaliphilus AHT 1 TaxID=555088 RepID=C0GJC0_DETAL|nr:small, acid-soluble spore protein, alpha/beta type [Dethiobacter alkaliphilus]EEG76605.1 small, acid-soluble spore protein, alpha/beta family [Dethiobacter alkaliphilus AHT 1]MCW3489113.1 alpha/beta-type small acid-soluble spore protein [Dethiobacter alkaliphilus]
MSPRRKPIMSDALKEEIAEELGVANVVRQDGWGSVSSRDCGNLVKMAIERAEKALMNGQ